MKKIKTEKKLELRKSTVTKLQEVELKSVKGGLSELRTRCASYCPCPY